MAEKLDAANFTLVIGQGTPHRSSLEPGDWRGDETYGEDRAGFFCCEEYPVDGRAIILKEKAVIHVWAVRGRPSGSSTEKESRTCAIAYIPLKILLGTSSIRPVHYCILRE